MRIAVVGAGGVGGYFGGRLAAAGVDVTFVARGAHLAAMRGRGLRIRSPLGDATIENPKAVDDVAKLENVDLIMVAVKLWDTEAVAATLAPLARRGAAVVSFQNGIDKDDVLRRFVPASAIVGGVSYISSFIAEPGVIQHNGTMQRLAFGEFGGAKSPRVQALAAACAAARVDAVASDAIEQLIWEKYVFLVGLSGATCATRKPIGPVLENARTRAFLLDLMREVIAVARAKGIVVRDGFAEERLAFFDTLPATMTSSMHTDLDRGNRLELAWLSGGVAKLGADLGVPTPMNRAVADVLALYADGAR